MGSKGFNRKDFIKASVAGLAGLLAAKVFAKKARALEPDTVVKYYEEPAVGQPGYANRIARLFKGKGLPERTSQY